MFNFSSLYSGSSGNCLFVETENTKILIDAGVSQRKIIDALASFNVDISEVDAILVTHEHSDHTKNLGAISQKYNIPVFINEKTLNTLTSQKDKISEDNQHIFTSNKSFSLKDLDLFPFSIPHDAADPCGFNIFYKGKKLTVATDIGHIENKMINNFKDSDFILLEANYDPDILKYSRYPYQLKQRILSPIGHLSNSTAGKTLTELVLKSSNFRRAMLGHLSKENNFPELALKTVYDELAQENITKKDVNIAVANRDFPSKLIKI